MVRIRASSPITGIFCTSIANASLVFSPMVVATVKTAAIPTAHIRLRFYEELSLQEISEAMGLNLNTVKAKLYRGLKALRVGMEGMKI